MGAKALSSFEAFGGKLVGLCFKIQKQTNKQTNQGNYVRENSCDENSLGEN